ncbi:hypothetical protein WEI85_06220 [Actinomycetes bacterium KLBMP 9797]
MAGQRKSATVGAVTALVVGMGAVPAAARAAGSASCTESGVTWRVDYETASTGFGEAATVTGLRRIASGGETDASTLTWELRYENLPTAYPPAGADPPPFQSVRGPLTPSGVERPVVLYLSPRLVTPDGACTVYLSPFPNAGAAATSPRVAVLGDELVHQLNDSGYNQNAIQGFLEGTLNAAGVRVEVEGHPGRRWTDTVGGSGLDGADGHLLDEYRGLLEHDVDGFVMALGRNDALHVAAGATAAERDARRATVENRLTTILGSEVTTRSGCVVAVTAPENATTVDPYYAAEALYFNNLIRFTAALDGTDAWEAVDFGAQARTHKASDPQPWFAADNLTLNAAGRLVYTQQLTRAAQRCSDSVVLWGRSGTLDQGAHGGKRALPSGQALNTRVAAGWDFVPGMLPWFSDITADGTIFFMNVQSAGNVFQPSGEGMTISAFHPDAGTFANIPIKTDRNKTVPVNGTDRLGANQLDVATLKAGNAVAFTGSFPHNGQNPETDGLWPAFGIVTKGPNGAWRVAEGPDANGDGRPDWRNSWSPRELYDATVAADPVHGPALADAICPLNTQLGVRSECAWASEMAVLPHTGDVVIAHYAPGIVSVLDVTGPDAAGRFGARVSAVYDFADIDDPSWPDALAYPDPQPAACPPSSVWGIPAPPEADRKVGLAPREVQADPSTAPGEPERFALSSDMAAYRYHKPQGAPDGCVREQTVFGGIIEFRYDPGAPPADRIRPASPPALTAELDSTVEPVSGLRNLTGMGPIHYDHQGNLWVPTGDGWSGLGVKVYANRPTGRKLSACVDPGTPIEAYRAEVPGARPMWGKVCPPDYNILQPKVLGPIFNITEDPATHNVVFTSWPHGTTVVVDPEGSGIAMTFRVSGVASLMAQAVTAQKVTGPCASDPAQRCTGGPTLAAMQGPVDGSGRLWAVSAQSTPPDIKADDPEMQMRDYDHWAYSVDLSRLMGREPQRLTARAGQASTVQAEVTKTLATTQRAGQYADRDVDSVAGVSGCAPSTCTDPVSGLTAGLAVGDDSNAGVAAGTVVGYRVVVPKPGAYRLTYRAADRTANGTAARIRLAVNGATHETVVPSTGMAEAQGPLLTLPAGTHTVELSAPTAATAGWQLDWITFARQ